MYSNATLQMYVNELKNTSKDRVRAAFGVTSPGEYECKQMCVTMPKYVGALW